MKDRINTPRLLIEIIAAVALAEVVVMFLLPRIAPGVAGGMEFLLNAALLSLLAGPTIMWRVRGAIRRIGMSQDIANAARPGLLVAGTAGVLGLGLAATAAAVVSISRGIHSEARTRFEHHSERLVAEAQRRVTQSRYGLAGARGVYAASKSVERGEFAAHVASRDLPKEFPGAIGFGFIQRVMRPELETFIAAERADDAPDFAVWGIAPPGSALEHADDLYVIKHCFPKERNAPAWGLDIGSEPNRREAAEFAARSGEPAITRRIALVQDEKTQTGFLFLVPVYRNGTNPTTPEERMATLTGLAYAPIILEEALAGAADSVGSMLDFEIFQGDQPSAASQLYDLDKHLAADDERVDGSDYDDRMFHQTHPLRIGGQVWTLITSTTPAFHATVDRTTPAIMGLGGAALSLLLAGVVWMMGSARWQAIRLAQRMTADLAAAKASAERLAEIARRTSNAVVITDAQGCVEWVNEGFTRISGYTLEDVRGRKPGHVLQGQDTDKAEATRVGRAIAAGSNVSAEFVNYHKSGRAYRIAIEISPLFNESKELTGFMAIENDITERVESQRRLAESMRAAEAANSAKSTFLANMSHEIRTPLTAILGFTDLLREDGDLAAAPERRVQAIDTIKNAGQHLLTVINDILDLSKIEAGKMAVERIETPLVQVLHEVESLMRPRAASKGLRLRVKLDSPVPERITSDPTRLRQILLNLAGNAIKFTEVGGVSINAAMAESGGASTLVIDVEDTGLGMTAEQCERLFQAFSQADEATTRKFGGTGLGLTICRRLAALMDGDVTLVRTELGKGSCFRLVLPVEPVPGSAMTHSWEAVIAPDNPLPKKPAGMLRGRVLLAEDGLDNQRLITFHLRKAGASVEVADNGKIALEMLDKAHATGNPFDLLLTDMQMPEMDGYTLARTLRASGSRLPIVALTAHAMAGERKACIDSGCDDYASKPIDKAALVAVCAKWMQNAHGGAAQSDAA